MKQTFIGYHGTLACHAESIRQSGVSPSDNDDDWLGEGTYFFVEGLDDPQMCAAQWARAKAWDKKDQEFDHPKVAVITATIEVDVAAVYDLREPANARRFHKARRRWLRTRIPRRSTHLPRPVERTYDTDLLDQFKWENGIDALISDVHIQFSLRERHFRLDSRIPNVSILCLSNPAPATVVQLGEIQVFGHTSQLESETE